MYILAVNWIYYVKKNWRYEDSQFEEDNWCFSKEKKMGKSMWSSIMFEKPIRWSIFKQEHFREVHSYDSSNNTRYILTHARIRLRQQRLHRPDYDVTIPSQKKKIGYFYIMIKKGNLEFLLQMCAHTSSIKKMRRKKLALEKRFVSFLTFEKL